MRVLIIGPYAPHGQVGPIRMISLSRYLVNNGHQVTVLCLSEKVLEDIDPQGLSAKVPVGVKVVPYDITSRCNSVMKKNAINEVECCGALNALLDKEEFDVALISGGPFYQFKCAVNLRKKGIPYIVDYRDLHISSPDKRKRNKILDKLKFLVSYPARYMQEYRCIRPANLITVVAPEMKVNISSYFHLNARKIHVVYNGFDDEALKDIQLKENKNAVFTIGYFGKLMYYNQELTSMLFNVIEKMNSKTLQVKLLHIGPENKAIQKFFSEKNMNGDRWYECMGQKDYREGIELLSACDACALEYVYPEGPGTKVFDYIFLNKPIIGVLKPGISLERLLSQFQNAFICHNEYEIEKAIENLLSSDIRELVCEPDQKRIIDEFSRSKQNKHFEDLMTSISLKGKIEHGS